MPSEDDIKFVMDKFKGLVQIDDFQRMEKILESNDFVYREEFENLNKLMAFQKKELS